MSKKILLFDKPIWNDWLFWLYVFFVGSGALSTLMNYAGVKFTTFYLVAISIDIFIVVLLTWLILVLPISLIRSAIRK
jgi:hypothetical protein